MSNTFQVYGTDGSSVTITLPPRVAWALRCLNEAGANGCTPIDTPGPRWSQYVFVLRSRGIDVETVTEMHGPPFPGHHARYVLHTRVEELEDA